MIRAAVKLAFWAYLAWLLFCVPVEGRVWARHLAELWALPPVQAKVALAKRQAWGVLWRLRAALPEPPPPPGQHPAPDLDRLGASGQGAAALARDAAWSKRSDAAQSTDR